MDAYLSTTAVLIFKVRRGASDIEAIFVVEYVLQGTDKENVL